ncbi:MAG TPA: glycosyltransferase family 39 protein [Candidatus Dormibacteraeota bacterium]|nr:glycosyltransferase family 39 protein [Candidatus Dormibacteraeota bacterium]
MRSSPHPALVFAVIFAAIFLLHSPLLQLPYFWDEAGYYVPAARDLLLSGTLIPHTTISNAHPPLVLAWIALWWKCVGYAPLVTRSAMLVVAAFSLLGVFRLAERAANTQVAVASTLCTALYPVFFAQSSLAQVDLAAAGLTFWGLHAYLEERPRAVAIWFSLAVLAKETAILAPAALAAWQILRWVVGNGRFRALWREPDAKGAAGFGRILTLLIPILPLAAWYAYHYSRTGYVFGNAEFFRYNVASTLNPLRFLLAVVLRLWQTFGYLHLWLLTGAMLLAMLLPPLKDGDTERPRIAIPVQMLFLVVIVAYVVVMALIGGAVLARYLLPAVPLVVLEAVSTLRRRLRHWTAAVALVTVAFIAAWFWNPPYGFSPEDNLAYRDYVVLHQDAERVLEAQYPMAHVLTAWPASDELTRPWLGYTTRPMQVVRIEDFSLEQVVSAADFRQNFDVALVFSTKYEPARPLLGRWQAWTELKRRFFGYERDLPAAAAAQILGGRVVFSESRKGQRIAVIEIQKAEIFNARVGAPPLFPRLAGSAHR